MKRLCIASWILSFLIVLAAVLYPVLSSHHKAAAQEKIYCEYQNTLESIPDEEITGARSAAEFYNRHLIFTKNHIADNGNYAGMLDVTKSGIMAYITIPKINAKLPIYHGSGDTSELESAWHMWGSSLPVGGESSHAAICAHSGFTSCPLFSDLELLRVGDTFQIEVLGEMLSYEVYNIEVVLPEQIESIFVREGEDLVTLVTCSPLGETTHRLLVHGSRTLAPEITETEQTESVWLGNVYKQFLPSLALIAVFPLAITVFFLFKKRKHTA